MIRTGDCLFEPPATIFHQLRAAMLTDIVKGAHLTIIAPHHNHTLRQQIKLHIVASFRDFCIVTDAMPGRIKDRLRLSLKDIRVVIIARRKGQIRLRSIRFPKDFLVGKHQVALLL